MHRLAQVELHNRLEEVVQKCVLDADMLGGAKHVSRMGTQLRVEKKSPDRFHHSRWTNMHLG